MARLIDADELLRRYDETHEGPPGNARKLIEEAPTVGGWVSVKDRLPKGECIAYSRNFGEMMMGFIGETNEGDTGYCCDSNTEWLGDVTHWMPLPEPPKGE